jgi:hypothetical protein
MFGGKTPIRLAAQKSRPHDRGEEAVARGAARCLLHVLLHVLGRSAKTDACGRSFAVFFEVAPSPLRGLLELQLRLPPGPSPQGPRRPPGPSPHKPRKSSRFSWFCLAPAQQSLFWPAPVAPNEASTCVAVGHAPEPMHSPLPRIRDSSLFLCRLS